MVKANFGVVNLISKSEPFQNKQINKQTNRAAFPLSHPAPPPPPAPQRYLAIFLVEATGRLSDPEMKLFIKLIQNPQLSSLNDQEIA